jgi:DNA-binding CsgD family transcriptional regulator
MAVKAELISPVATAEVLREGLSQEAIEVLGASPYPALLLEMPSQRVVASSLAASRLLDPRGATVLGRTLEEFTADSPTGSLDLFSQGRLDGVEAFRTLRRPDGADLRVRMWFRRFDHQPPARFVIVVIIADQLLPLPPSSRKERRDAAVVGMADTGLVVERISSDAEALFGRPASALLGRSLISLVAEHDVPSCLSALEEASTSQAGVTLYLELRTAYTGDDASSSAIGCEVLILPLQPSPSCAFVLLPTPVTMPRTHLSTDLATILRRVGAAAGIADVARRLPNIKTGRDVPGLDRLTTREYDLLTRLLQGDRVPAIAVDLFLTQSTIRSHLASIFRKLDVTSQQKLLDLFRTADPKNLV